MMINMQTQLTDVLAFARSAMHAIEALIQDQRPAMALVPLNDRRSPASHVSCDRGYEAITGASANAAVRTHADPITTGWRSLDFGKTKTGDNRHSQPSRFAT